MATTTITVDDTDVQSAANFLQQFLTDSVPNGDFNKGTALRDLAVGALASVFAYLTAEATNVRQLQSLNSVQAATGGDPDATRDAVVAILSNAFINLKNGTKARGSALVHLSQQADIFVLPSHQFTRQAGYVFTIDSDSTQPYYIAASQLIPIIDAAGAVTEWQCRLPLVATQTGDAYNIDPGLFASYDQFSPYITRIENTDKFAGGNPAETVSQVLARAPTAISVRNLINERSITAVLDDEFPETKQVFVAGMGMPEMQRDIIQGVATHLMPHVGGCVDIYPLLDVVQTTFTGTVGALFERPDGVIAVFRDSTQDFSSVEVGDIIRITDGFPGADAVPRTFLVAENQGTSLLLNDKTPFPLATDEQSPATNVSYTIGRVGPSFNDVLSDVAGAPLTTGVTSRQVASSGKITMPGLPVMDILDVAILNPPPAEAGLKNPADGFVHFPIHVNSAADAPDGTITQPDALQYVTTIHNPLYAQSARMYMELQVGPADDISRWDGCTLRVTYRTLVGFASMDSFVTNPTERTVCADQLTRGHNPISLKFALQYALNPTATGVYDDSVITAALVDYMNSFVTSAVPLDATAIYQFLRDNYPNIGSIVPFSAANPISYVLFDPTGQLRTFQTTDIVEMDPSKQVDGPTDDFGLYGVTNRTVRYLANTVDINVTRKA